MEEFLELFDYNAWAHRIIFDAVALLPEEQYHRDLKSSYGGIHGTLAHIVWAEQLWLHRWQGKPNPAVAQGADLKSLAEARTRWEAVEAERGRFVAGLSAANLQDTRLVKPSSGGEYVHTFAQMFRHFINHSSYHRGQIVTFLRQLGSKPPSTDLILYYRRPRAVGGGHGR
ncbi:MAG TPA: DinB family protein [Gemmatimonadales bacterium]|nr:DinB family protein [Gemmatimonadales bacterium]